MHTHVRACLVTVSLRAGAGLDEASLAPPVLACGSTRLKIRNLSHALLPTNTENGSRHVTLSLLITHQYSEAAHLSSAYRMGSFGDQMRYRM